MLLISTFAIRVEISLRRGRFSFKTFPRVDNLIPRILEGREGRAPLTGINLSVGEPLSPGRNGSTPCLRFRCESIT